jgi:hypothetical protein
MFVRVKTDGHNSFTIHVFATSLYDYFKKTEIWKNSACALWRTHYRSEWRHHDVPVLKVAL